MDQDNDAPGARPTPISVRSSNPQSSTSASASRPPPSPELRNNNLPPTPTPLHSSRHETPNGAQDSDNDQAPQDYNEEDEMDVDDGPGQSDAGTDHEEGLQYPEAYDSDRHEDGSGRYGDTHTQRVNNYRGKGRERTPQVNEDIPVRRSNRKRSVVEDEEDGEGEYEFQPVSKPRPKKGRR
ncbi:hypothetical protein VKT23_017734 [Stygiomarasmius scandens]|uniref:Uncharacterized protein n=1 Tax=Marasmiellus scandens TaxID=2682957 RepID=A0ABR1IVI6_9AGAR